VDLTAFRVSDPSHAGEVRRAAVRLAEGLGFDEEDAGRAALVATEATSNVVKHAGSGEVLLQTVRRGEHQGIELVALDRGPGIGDPKASLRDGFSTAGTSGTGLGAIRRLADAFDLHTAAGHGSALLARLWQRPAPPAGAFAWGAVAVPKTGEEVAGDGWAVLPRPYGLRVMVTDGLGHGPEARKATDAALAVFRSRPDAALTSILESCHDALRATRGAAVAALDVDREAREVRFLGVGNVTASLTAPSPAHMVSMSGVVGQGPARMRAFT
jgi:anti-sigma regulatory factor (Ser/Thr protein kinase)